jgi:MFS family permease
MAFSSGVLLGLVLLYLTRVDVVAKALSKQGLNSPVLITFILLAIGFFGIRFFGQGILTMVSRNMVMKWFDKRRGMANAILGIFAALGFAIAPKILSQVIERLEWKGAWVFLAILVGFIFAFFVLLIYRDNPEDCGLKPDGKLKVRKKKKRPPSLPDRDFTLKEAHRTLAFWAFTLGLGLSALYISGLTFHIVSVFETAGMTKEMGLGIFVPTSVIAVLLQFGASYASDYIRLKYLLLLFAVGMLVTTLGLIMLGGMNVAYWLVITGNGIVWGLYSVLIGVTWPRFYGLKNLGAISGSSLSFTVAGSALGPYMFSLSLEMTGSYDLVGWICMSIAVFLFVLAFKADNPNENEKKQL